MSKIKTKIKIYLGRFKHFFRNPNFQIIVLVLLIVVDTLMITNFLSSLKSSENFFCPNKFVDPRPAGEPVLARLPELQHRALDGVVITDGQPTSTRPLAVVIENHFEARPQTGLADANLVYEFLTEGGITRFLTFYDASGAIEKIGPVRSCRPYFLNVAEEFQALFTHVGGSPACLDLLASRSFDVYNLDEYAKTNYFWRDKLRQPPHNVYISIKSMSQYLADKEIDSQFEFELWEFKDEVQSNDLDDSSSLASTAKIIRVDFGVSTYNIEWHYNKKANNYKRYVMGEPHQDLSGQIVKAKNIIVQSVKARVLDSLGRLSFQMEGRGDSLIFQDGLVLEGYWKKPDRRARTRFYSSAGEEIRFNRGTTWIEVLPTDREVSYE